MREDHRRHPLEDVGRVRVRRRGLGVPAEEHVDVPFLPLAVLVRDECAERCQRGAEEIDQLSAFASSSAGWPSTKLPH